MEHTAFAPHDHARCIADTIAAAEAHCALHRLRLTPVRRRVLEILLGAHRAIGAYDILARLAAEGLGSQPPVVYRALDFLTGIGFVHRIEKLNAYVACTDPGTGHAPAFMICRACAAVAETPGAPGRGALDAAAQAAGFRIERAVIEAEGLCPDCASGAGHPG
jgi:Fur family zinc uptake transcriptional regulator